MGILERFFVSLFLMGVVFAFFSALMAKDRGRNVLSGFIAGGIFGVWSAIYYLIAGDSTELRVRKEEAIKKSLRHEKLTQAESRVIKHGSSTGNLVTIAVVILGLLFLRWMFFPSGTNSSSSGSKPTATNTTTSGTSSTTISVPTYTLSKPFDLQGNSLFASDDGNYSWKVTGSSLKKLDSVTAYTKAKIVPQNGKFYLFVFDATNDGKTKQDLGFSVVNDLELFGANGAKYSKLENSTLTVSIQSENYGLFSDYYSQKEVNPGAKARDYIIFDVPEQSYKLCDPQQKDFCIDGIN